MTTFIEYPKKYWTDEVRYTVLKPNDYGFEIEICHIKNGQSLVGSQTKEQVEIWIKRSLAFQAEQKFNLDLKELLR